LKLLIVELQDDDLKQQLRTPDRTVHIDTIRPHIYKHRNPAGDFFIQIQDVNEKIIKNSNTLTEAQINSADFFHGYVSFELNASLTANTLYNISLRSTGYTFAESDYIGWCKDYELKKYDRTYPNNEGLSSALDMEVWELKNTEKGQS